MSVRNKASSRKALIELPAWLGNAILCVIQQLKADSHAKANRLESVQILIEAINGRKNKLTTVANEGEGKLHLCPGERKRERWSRKRFDFSNQIWEGTYRKITEGKQYSGTYILHDVELKLGNICEMFRADFGAQLGWI